METVDDRVRDILRVKFLTGLFDHPYSTEGEMAAADREVDGPENNEVALRASLESLVLLKNDGILPLDASSLKKVAVLGPNADEDGYAHTHYGPQATESVTVYQGLKKALEGRAEVVYAKGCAHVDSRWPDSETDGFEPTQEEMDGIAEAVRTARGADVAVVVAGGNLRTCGENRSRTSLDLPPIQELLLKEVHKAGIPLVVVLVNGRPLSINWADRNARAILEGIPIRTAVLPWPGRCSGTIIPEASLRSLSRGRWDRSRSISRTSPIPRWTGIQAWVLPDRRPVRPVLCTASDTA